VETTQRDPILGPIRMLFEVGTVAGMSDGQLLDRFLARRDEEGEGEGHAEVAFAALVERHGPMVLRICRGRLGDEHDAEDAFQATFFILARKASAIRKHESAASWLNGVAREVASCARRSAALRRAKERSAAGLTRESGPVADRNEDELVPAILEEVDILPEKYRTPLRLCLLEGLTHEEAANRLGWPVGTVKTRVRWAKERLRTRLARRGLAPSLGAIGAALASVEASAMPARLVRSTVRDALRFGTAPGGLSAPVAALVELGLGSLLMNRWKMAALVFASMGIFAAGAMGLARPGPQEKGKPAEGQPVVAEKAAAKPNPAEVAEAERIAQSDRLDHVKLIAIDVELLRMELEGWKER
jgi:RNA polymerase sigma factor (sigma-70 family)